ncbi:MAG: cytochrome P450 [Verrucomicrobia bacterium]|nr:MAG: cytochrome P450 [Verrucomicrobiota bacterium]PYL62945.1 MAG: cytochrome P450 [Verrucomicrobiota bacterium]
MLVTAKPLGPKNPWLAYAALYRDPLGYLIRAARKHGDVVHLKIGRKSDFLLNHPDLVRAALLDHENLRRCVNRPLRWLFGTGLLTCRSERHKQQRALLQPMFSRERIVSLGDVMVAQTMRWANRWRDGATVDMAEEMMELAMSITAKALFNVDLSCKSAELRNTLATLLQATRFKNLIVTSKQFEKLSLPFHRRFARAAEKLDSEICAMIAERKKGACDDPDLLSTMLRLRRQSRIGLTDQQIRDQILTFFTVGHETTATGMMWTWYLLSENREVAKRLYSEVDHVLGDRLPSGRDCDRLRYTRMVFAESMRLYPPIWMMTRRAVRDMKINGLVIRNGSYVHLSPFVMHRDPRYFPDPERFDPDRWTPEAAATRPKFSYFPFGGGPLQCIGEGFAWTQAILVISTLARGWQMRVVPGHRIELDPHITLRSRYGMPMILERRK